MVDQLTGHVALKPKDNQSAQPSLKIISPTLKQTINSGLAHLITNIGFQITVAEGQRHAKVGLAESAVFTLKKLLIRIFPTKPLNIETYINERPTFAIQDQYFTPNIFKIATLKRASAPMSVNSLSETIFPATKELRDAIFLISADNKKMLTNLSRKLLNYRNNTYLTEKVKVGNFVIIPDRLTLKSFSSIHSAIAWVLDVKGCGLKLKLANNQIIT